MPTSFAARLQAQDSGRPAWRRARPVRRRWTSEMRPLDGLGCRLTRVGVGIDVGPVYAAPACLVIDVACELRRG